MQHRLGREMTMFETRNAALAARAESGHAAAAE
jgi:hypothetical protein